MPDPEDDSGDEVQRLSEAFSERNRPLDMTGLRKLDELRSLLGSDVGAAVAWLLDCPPDGPGGQEAKRLRSMAHPLGAMQRDAATVERIREHARAYRGSPGTTAWVEMLPALESGAYRGARTESNPRGILLADDPAEHLLRVEAWLHVGGTLRFSQASARDHPALYAAWVARYDAITTAT